jgi:hypothetical protein
MILRRSKGSCFWYAPSSNSSSNPSKSISIICSRVVHDDYIKGLFRISNAKSCRDVLMD